MKSVIHVLIHPITICVLFSFLIISGESTGYFYIFLLIMGLMEGILHSFLGMLGICLLILSLFVSDKQKKHLTDITGALCMLISLIRFFTQPGADYNYNTFRESVPLILMIVFLSLLLSNLLYHLLQFKNRRFSS